MPGHWNSSWLGLPEAYRLEKINHWGKGRVKCVKEIKVGHSKLNATADVFGQSCTGCVPTEVESLEVDEAHYCVRVNGSVWYLNKYGENTGLQ